MKNFIFDKNAPILLYGAAAIGNIMHENLKQQHFHVIGFMDKRACELSEFRGLPVYSMDDSRLSPKERSNIVVIVSVKNVFEHEQIVLELLKCGYRRVIYKSKSVLNGHATEDREALSTQYDIILANQSVEEKEFAETDTVEINEYKDNAVIFEEDTSIIVNLPMEFIYTNDYRQSESKWGNVNILSFFTHLGFFRFLSGDTAHSYEDYVNEYCIYTAPSSVSITEGWKNNVVRNRAMIFEQMNLSSELDSDFFIRNAPEAKWNKKGYFNLTSGKHRAAFFASKNQKFMPIKISKEDYQAFLVLSKADELNRLLQDNYVAELPLPIQHPYFYNYPCIAHEYYQKMISYYSDFIAQKIYSPSKELKWNRLTIIEITENPYGILNHFSRMGCNTYRVGEKKYEKNIFNDILHSSDIIELQPEAIPSVSVDYMFIETDDLYHLNKMLEKFSPKYCILTCDIHFVPAIEHYRLLHTAFRTYKENRLISVLCLQKENENEID